jgi:hypothetical protein
MMNGDLFPIGRRLAVVLAYRVVEPQLPGFSQLQNRGGGKLLAHRREFKIRVYRVWYLPILNREAVTALDEKFAVFLRPR